MKKSIIAHLVLIALFASCNSKNKDSSSVKNKNDSTTTVVSEGNGSTVTSTSSHAAGYQLIINGCDTGSHIFNSKKEYCEGLENDALNNRCALAEREDLHKQECSEFGEFEPVFEAKSAVGKDLDKNKINDNSRLMQITVLNFLSGGYEHCNVKDSIFTFSILDENKKTTLCRNSKVEVSVTSHLGLLIFQALDVTNDNILTSSSSSDKPFFAFGDNKGMLRYQAENPYGFTYVMAEEVTGIDPALLAEWNVLKNRLSTLRAQILNTQMSGGKVSSDLLAEAAELEAKMEVLKDKMIK